MGRPLFPGVEPWRAELTHRVQLPFEYNEGHETNNDKYRAEAQVGENVAREVTWEDREDKMRAGQGHQRRPGPSKSSQAWVREAVPTGPQRAGPHDRGHLSVLADHTTSVTDTVCRGVYGALKSKDREWKAGTSLGPFYRCRH